VTEFETGALVSMVTSFCVVALVIWHINRSLQVVYQTIGVGFTIERVANELYRDYLLPREFAFPGIVIAKRTRMIKLTALPLAYASVAAVVCVPLMLLSGIGVDTEELMLAAGLIATSLFLPLWTQLDVRTSFWYLHLMVVAAKTKLRRIEREIVRLDGLSNATDEDVNKYQALVKERDNLTQMCTDMNAAKVGVQYDWQNDTPPGSGGGGFDGMTMA
jgi:hypothetical protein